MGLKVLLIWEVIPEDTKFFIAEGLSNLAIESLRKCHSHFINLDNTEEIDDELAILQSVIYPENNQEGPSGLFTEINKADVVECKPDLIFHTGTVQ